MTFAEFQNKVRISKEDIYRLTHARFRGMIRVKNEDKVIANLEKIFNATLKISNHKGFQAMSMRDLSQATGLSMGALYSYFTGKDEILAMLQEQRRAITSQILVESIAAETDPREKLRAAVRAHLYLSEAMQPWFYFSYMEAKNLSPEEKARAVASERFTEQLLSDIIEEGQRTGEFAAVDGRLTASVLKAMLQDWYLKRGKYARRNVTVEDYGRFLLDFLERCLCPAAFTRKTAYAEGISHDSHRSGHGSSQRRSA